MAFECEIISVSELLYCGRADRLSLPGIEGEFTVLTNHSPMITLLSTGIVKVHEEDQSAYFTVNSGTVDIRPDKVIVLAGIAENVEDLKLEDCIKARDHAKAQMDEAENMSSEAYKNAKLNYIRENNRIKAIRTYGAK